MPEEKQEKFAVYLMNKEGRYQEPEWTDINSALNTARAEMKNYHEVRVTDQSDFLVLQIKEGRVLFPSKLDIIAYNAQNQN